MSRFPTTQWSLIDLASCEATTGTREQMGRLLESYRQPMYVHLRGHGVTHERAEDLVQDFILEILNKNLLAIADPQRGKFRTLLLTALDRFLVSRHRYETAAKRSPERLTSLDALQSPDVASADVSPQLVFERAWALDVLAQALARMQEECEQAGESARWAVFEAQLIGPLLEDAPKTEYEELARQLGLPDGKVAMNLLVTAKRQFARTLRDLVRDYVTRAADPDQQRELVTAQLLNGNTDRETAARVAGHLVEQSARNAVEEEIDQLTAILARSRTVADTDFLSDEPAPGTSPLKSRFWRQLTGNTGLDQLYTWGTEAPDDEEVPLDSYFSALLDCDLSGFVGLRVEAEGTLRDCLYAESPAIDTLKAIKDWANLLRATRDRTLPVDLASGVYYLVVAVALVRCGAAITGLDRDALRTGFTWLSQQDWLDDQSRPIVDGALKQTGTK